MGTDLTSISTFGWFTDPVLTDKLTPISTFGWYYISVITDVGAEIVQLSFCLDRIIQIQLSR